MASPRTLYLRVGALVLVGAALAVGFTLFLTANRFGGDGQVYETYLRESVQGLEVGGAVRYRGVSIGRITEIGLVSTIYTREGMSPLTAPFQLVLVRFAVDNAKVGTDNPSVEEAVQLGLRMRLASQGITGVSYLEADFVDPARFRPPELPWQPKFPFIPAIPSTVAQVTNAAETILQRLQEVDVVRIVAEIGGLIGDLRGELAADGDLTRSLREATELLATLRDTATRAAVPETLAELRGAAAELRTLLGSREIKRTLTAAADAATELRGAAQRLPASLDATLRSARSATSDLQGDLAPVLRELRAVATNLRTTSETLRRSPGQAILGGPPPLPEDRRW